MRVTTLLFLITLCFFSASAQSDFALKTSRIDSLMRAHIVSDGKRPVHSFLLYAHNKTTGFEFHQGVGTVGRNHEVIDAGYQYNVASITKTVVATIILQLEEEGKLRVEDKAASYLNGLDFLRFDDFQYWHDSACARDLTIEQLLQHTSGIADIFTDAATRFNISVLLHKKRQYTTEMIIQKYYQYHLNKKALHKPGQGYHYSDMNYMLLGFIIEQVTGKSLPQAVRERILEPCGMTDTYFEFYESRQDSGKRIDAFLNRINMTRDINTSYEWGGGGLVSTTQDMATFIESLFNLKFFRYEATLNKMIDFSATSKFGANYGMGIYKYELNGKVFYGHGGFYGSVLAYSPAEKVTFSANIGQANPPYDTGKLVQELMDVILTP
jgi:D-alanyl-D-alanine carboxypeptidase